MATGGKREALACGSQIANMWGRVGKQRAVASSAGVYFTPVAMGTPHGHTPRWADGAVLPVHAATSTVNHRLTRDRSQPCLCAM
ncbi:hypothetical protein DPEC_G00304490 [Dallia pectoralis]|uniref:Uncharacterized protein n=1 Tax=Dallia pectoralis TaxID=75939 RepID=A0ACC2FDN4_DALPE|nr:hypothetical protein DPEC_G00304490 [Dallia pectoralis]